jgi:hypothetical protein
MEPEGSLPSLQELSTCTYPEPDQSPSIIRIRNSRRMRWAGHVARMGENKAACRLLVRKLKGKRPLGRRRRGWVDNVKMDLVDIGWGSVDKHRSRALVNAVMNYRIS